MKSCPIVFAERPILDNDFDLRIVDQTVEAPQAFEPFFKSVGIAFDALRMYSLLVSFPSSFGDLGVDAQHLPAALTQARGVLESVLPAHVTQLSKQPSHQVNTSGITPPPASPAPLGYQVPPYKSKK